MRFTKLVLSLVLTSIPALSFGFDAALAKADLQMQKDRLQPEIAKNAHACLQNPEKHATALLTAMDAINELGLQIRGDVAQIQALYNAQPAIQLPGSDLGEVCSEKSERVHALIAQRLRFYSEAIATLRARNEQMEQLSRKQAGELIDSAKVDYVQAWSCLRSRSYPDLIAVSLLSYVGDSNTFSSPGRSPLNATRIVTDEVDRLWSDLHTSNESLVEDARKFVALRSYCHSK